ncbi:hypothetical protein RRG08_049162 [Elysia crispata]|uniref:Uncharacterized protein n=1 Tax=Elysia crispata TaxID=231223 RepID=A0AAE1E4E8_9GAST|nr:hypothetical protein RRG08_049162 [Elysia crispata]
MHSSPGTRPALQLRSFMHQSADHSCVSSSLSVQGHQPEHCPCQAGTMDSHHSPTEGRVRIPECADLEAMRAQ